MERDLPHIPALKGENPNFEVRLLPIPAPEMRRKVVPRILLATAGARFLTACFRSNSVPHPFAFFLAKGWDTTNPESAKSRGHRPGLPPLQFFAIILLLVAGAATPLAAQEPTLHVEVKLVNVFVNVTDKTGAIVGGLTLDDFALAEDGRPQQIKVFERQSELPLNLTLAIDTSGSVHKDMAMETDAAKRFAHALLRPQDQMRLMEFATEVRELTPFTSKLSQIDSGLGRLRGDYATALYDAIYLGAEGLGRKEGRKVLVLVSDGDDTASNSTYAKALEQALRNEVMIYSIIDVPIESSAGRDLGGEHALITLAEQTGGKHFYASDGGLDKAFARVSDDLRTQYLLGYYPKNQEPGRTFHRVQVTIPRAAAADFSIRHRTGYYADTPPKGN
jgi:Ca-activated chloride channel family protein